MREGSSSPTRTAARPGVTPRPARARTRPATSERISEAMAFPSITRAVIRPPILSAPLGGDRLRLSSEDLGQEPLGPFLPRLLEEPVRRAFLDQKSLVEEEDPVGDLLGEPDLV